MQIVRPGDAGYEAVRHVYGAVGAPDLVVRPQDATEVPEALALARSAPGPLAVRSGGHGISSIATNDGGSVLDLGLLDRIERTGDRTVRLGPGARWGDVAHVLYPWGLAISSGDSGDVGVGGLATTGGLGLMARAHGLTIDRIRSADLVTADGAMHHLSAGSEPDLFWALRGAGANVGVAVSFELEAAPTPLVARASLMYTPVDLAAFLERWGSTVESAPRDASAFLYVGAGPQPFAQATVVVATDDADAATAALQPFLALPGLAGSRGEILPYAEVPLTSGAVHRGQQAARTRTGLADHLDTETAARIAALLRHDAIAMVQIRSAGGAVNDVAEDATAYAHRHQQFSVTAMSVAPLAALEAAWAPVWERMDGLYLSFESDHSPDRIEAAFPPATLRRLRAIKARWDPEDVFSQNFDVAEVRPLAVGG